MRIEDDYFGISKKYHAGVAPGAGTCPYRTVCRVPSRREVACLPFGQLREILIGWMVHSPAELNPSRGQIVLVLEILSQRDDAGAMGDLRTLCSNYIHGA